MKYITDLHNRHAGEPVWIAGSDPTLEGYPDDFFDDKIGITLHLAHVKFPNATYRYANEPDRVELLAERDPSYLSKENIFAWPFYAISRKESARISGGTDRAYYLKYRPYPPYGIRGMIGWEFTRRKVRQAREGTSIRFGGHGTCLHGALFAAVMFGASSINVIGASLGMIKGGHFGEFSQIDKEVRPAFTSFDDPIHKLPMIEQTVAIFEACRELGIEVNWIKEYEPAGAYTRFSLSRKDVDKMKVQALKKLKLDFRKRIKNKIKSIYNPLINRF